jgi:hypothetical protein
VTLAIMVAVASIKPQPKAASFIFSLLSYGQRQQRPQLLHGQRQRPRHLEFSAAVAESDLETHRCRGAADIGD